MSCRNLEILKLCWVQRSKILVFQKIIKKHYYNYHTTQILQNKQWKLITWKKIKKEVINKHLNKNVNNLLDINRT